MNNKLPLLCGCIVFSLAAGLFAQSGDAPDAQKLLQDAHEASSLSRLLPYQFHAVVVINPNTPGQKKGVITILRDKDRSRTELAVEDYREVTVTLGNKLYVARSMPMPAPGLSWLTQTDHIWDPLIDDGEGKFGDVSRKKVQNTQTQCFDVKGPQHHRLCFDPERKVLLEKLDRQHALEFTDYRTLDHVLLPRKITVLAELRASELPILTLEEIEAKSAVFAADTFAVPEHALELGTCEGMQPAKPVKTPRPDFGANLVRRNMSTPVINAYGVVDKDGVLQNIAMLATNSEIREAILDALKKWRFTPAMCGATPVATEKEIPIPLFEGDGGDGGAPRGRR